MYIGLSHVAVDQQHFFTGLGKLYGKVANAHSLSVRRMRARPHKNHVLSAFELIKDSRSNKTEVFTERVVGMVIRNQGGIGLLRFAIHLTRLRRNIFEVRNEGANLHQNWRAAHAHNVGRRVERCIRNVDDISQRNASNETKRKAHH